MPRVAGTAAGNDGYFDAGLDVPDQLQVKATIAPVAVNHIEQDLAGTHRLDRLRQLFHVQVSLLPSPLDRAGVPDVLAAITVWKCRLNCVVRRLVSLPNEYSFRVDADHHRLRPVRSGDLLNRRFPA